MLRLVVFSSLFIAVSALQCYHHVLDLDYKTMKDGGLKECAPHHKFCIYLAVTAFVPRERNPYPVHFEQVGCHSGKNYEPGQAGAYVGFPLEELCDGTFSPPRKWNFLWNTADSTYNITERVNEVACCTTDGCNKEHYFMVGGGQTEGSWYSRFTGMVSQYL